MGLRVLVVGAGIAGSAAAALLGRAGHEVTLVEQDRRPRSSGSPVDVRGPALPVVRGLGLTADLRRHDTGVDRVEFLDGSGAVRARATMRRNSAEDVEIGRCALDGILRRAAAEVAEFVPGEGPTELRDTRDGVEVVSTGGRRRVVDLVVGADGQHSTVRRLAFGPERAYSRPFGLLIATVPVPPETVGDPGVVRIVNHPGASLAVHPAGGHPMAAFILRTPLDRPPGRDELRRLLQDFVGDRAPWAGEVARAVDGTGDVYVDTVNRVQVPSWSHGRVVLLGDAASSITILGEGCSMALAGAGALADAVTAHPDLRAAQPAYEAVHRPRVRAAQRGARVAASVLVPRSHPGIRLRNLAVGLVGRV